jgi:ribosomal-protein-alanine N-acetyltransferase
MKSPIIETPNCIIKLLNDEQAHLLCTYYQRNKDYLEPWEPLRSQDFYTEKFWQQQVITSQELFAKKQAVRLVALNKNQDKVLATCNFTNIVWGSFNACHLGYSLDKDYQGKGIMYETVLAAINYIKQEFKLHRIMANHLPSNKRSEKLLKRLNFEKEGYAKSYLKINGVWQDHVLNALVI